MSVILDDSVDGKEILYEVPQSACRIYRKLLEFITVFLFSEICMSKSSDTLVTKLTT